MSLAIKFGDSNVNNSVTGVIYFDAVTDYSKQYGGKVTEHPIEAGASITDHYISSNKKYKIKGVISGIDFLSLPRDYKIEEEEIFNKKEETPAVQIPGASLLDTLIPDVISQFLGNTPPSPVLSEEEIKDYRLEIESALEEILHGLYYNEDRKKWENRMTLVTLYETLGSTAPSKIIENLVITSFSIDENAQTGDALFFDMSLEQVNFVELESAEAPKPPPKTKTARATEDKKQMDAAESQPQPMKEDPRISTGSVMGGE